MSPYSICLLDLDWEWLDVYLGWRLHLLDYVSLTPSEQEWRKGQVRDGCQGCDLQGAWGSDIGVMVLLVYQHGYGMLVCHLMTF